LGDDITIERRLAAQPHRIAMIYHNARLQRLSRFVSSGLALTLTATLASALPQGTWIQQSNLPQATYTPGCAYDSLNQLVYVFGGGDASAPHSTLDHWDWTVVPPVWVNDTSGTPSERLGLAMAADDAGNLVVFGGLNGSGLLQDTWKWDGTAWTQIGNGASGIQERNGAKMVFDDDRELFVLFGGAFGGNPTQYLNDTWTFDFATGWTQVTTSNAPAARFEYGMVYDERTRVVLLFGGTNDVPNTTGAFNDTWMFDGTTWTQLSPATQPSPRYGHSMAFDPTTGTTYLWGGAESNTGARMNDLWQWSWGNGWVQVSSTTSPTARNRAGFAYDESAGQFILCGGYFGGGSVSDETWSYLPDPADVTFYCDGLPNSVGYGAVIGYTGTTSISQNDFWLTASFLPPNQFGLFFYGPNQIQPPLPWGEGLRCVGGGPNRLGVVNSGSAGIATKWVDYNSPQALAGPIVAGSTWNFQYWYRDPAGGPAGYNASDALQATFKP